MEPGQRSATPPRETRDRRKVWIKRALAGAALAATAELTLGRRILFVYEAFRRAVKWAAKPDARPPAAPPPEENLPSAQHVMEGVVDEVITRGRRAVEQTRPVIERTRRRTRERLKEPAIGALVTGGVAIGAVATIGALPALIGVGTAYLVHRYAADAAKQSRRPAPSPATPEHGHGT